MQRGYGSSSYITIPSVTSGLHINPTQLTASHHPTTISVTSAPSITSPTLSRDNSSTPRALNSTLSPSGQIPVGAFSSFPVTSPKQVMSAMTPSSNHSTHSNGYNDSDHESNHSHRSSVGSLEQHTPLPMSVGDPVINTQLKEIHEDLTYTPTLPQYRGSGTSTLNRLLLENSFNRTGAGESMHPDTMDTITNDNDARYANDICVPHENYSGTAPLQSTTSEMDSASAILTDDEEQRSQRLRSSLMVQLMSDDDINMDDDSFYVGSVGDNVGNRSSRNHLMPIHPGSTRRGRGAHEDRGTAVTSLTAHSSEEGTSANEVKLLLVDNGKEDFLSKMYGLGMCNV